jgi:hypothetical protein
MVRHTYEFTVRGRLSPSLAAEFAHLDLMATTRPVQTVLHGPVEDPAALQGVLRQIEAFGLELVEVHRTPDDAPPPPSTD